MTETDGERKIELVALKSQNRQLIAAANTAIRVLKNHMRHGLFSMDTIEKLEEAIGGQE